MQRKYYSKKYKGKSREIKNKAKEKMANYKCFKCGKKVAHKAVEKTKGKCIYCDSRIFYKVRSTITRIKAV